MLINSDILNALHLAINDSGNRYQFSLKAKIPQQSIKRWLEGNTEAINDKTWEKLYPFLRTYLNNMSKKQTSCPIIADNSNIEPDPYMDLIINECKILNTAEKLKVLSYIEELKEERHLKEKHANTALDTD